MRQDFQAENFTEAIVRANAQNGAQLAQQFPRLPDDRNELPETAEEGGRRARVARAILRHRARSHSSGSSSGQADEVERRLRAGCLNRARTLQK
jgi:hypothetical protein